MDLSTLPEMPGLVDPLAPKWPPDWPTPPKWPDAKLKVKTKRKVCHVAIKTPYTGGFFSYHWKSPADHYVHTVREQLDRETFLCVEVDGAIALSTWRGTWLTYDLYFPHLHCNPLQMGDLDHRPPFGHGASGKTAQLI